MSDGQEPAAGDMNDGTPTGGEAKGDYTVGYGRPPEHGKIKKGEVRNPRGKRRGTRSFKTEMAEVLKTRVPTKGGKSVSARYASIMKLAEMALKGNLKAIDRLHEYALQLEEDEGNRASIGVLLAEDEQILANARARDREVLLADLNAHPLLPTAASTEKEIDQ